MHLGSTSSLRSDEPSRLQDPPPVVSIVIPVFNQAFFTRICLMALEREQGAAQVIVVDNTPPPVAAKYIVRSFTRDPDHGLYGLIDNEKG